MSNVTEAAEPSDRDRTRTQLLGLVEQIRDTLAECADVADSQGFYPEAGWRALDDTGLFRMKAPVELGGFEADPMTQLDVLEAVSYIDASAGWTLFVGAGATSIAAYCLSEEGLKEFMVDGRLPRTAAGGAPTGRARRVEGGYRLTGRWPFASGSGHAERLTGGGVVEGEESQPGLMFVFNPEDVTFHDNWTVSGLRGSGSQDISVEDVFVPEELTFNFMTPALRGGAVGRLGPLGSLSVDHAGVSLGAARRAMDEMAELAKTKTRGFANAHGVAARGKFQYDLGLAQTRLDAARANVLAVYEELWEVAQTQVPGPDLQIKVRCAAVHATEVGLDVCRTMFRYAGARSLYRGNVIERCLRDSQVAAQHVMVSDSAYEARGQLAAGLSDVNPFH